MQLCRGGASTIAEAACFGVIPVVIPLPAADDHQRKNAETLIKHNAGFMILQSQFQMEDLQQIMHQLMTDLRSREKISANLKNLSATQAAATIAHDICKEIGI